MDAVKSRIVIGVAGLFIGLGGLFTLCVAAVLGLAHFVGPIAAAFITAGVLLSGAVICLYIFVQPKRSLTEEAGEVKGAAADALSGLPQAAFLKLIDERPISLVTFAMLAGYSIVRGPGPALKLITQLLQFRNLAI